MNLQTAADPVWRRIVAMDAAQRRIAWAVAASVALHLLLLWPSALPRPTLELARPLAVTLRPAALPPVIAGPAAAISSALPLQTVPLAPVARSTSPPRSSALTVERAQKPPRPAPSTVSSAVAQTAPQTTMPEVPRSLLQGTPSPAQPVAGPAVAAAAVRQEDGVDGEALRQFRIAVARRVGHHDFPELAEEIGAGNASVVRVLIYGVAGPAAVTVARSSGHARLDAKAREIIGAGVRSTALPEGLRGREFATEFRVEFRPHNESGGD